MVKGSVVPIPHVGSIFDGYNHGPYNRDPLCYMPQTIFPRWYLFPLPSKLTHSSDLPVSVIDSKRRSLGVSLIHDLSSVMICHPVLLPAALKGGCEKNFLVLACRHSSSLIGVRIHCSACSVMICYPVLLPAALKGGM